MKQDAYDRYEMRWGDAYEKTINRLIWNLVDTRNYACAEL